MSNVYTVIYPPVVSFHDYITQRPQMLMKAFFQEGHYGMFCNIQDDRRGDLYEAMRQTSNRLYIVNHIHAAMKEQTILEVLRKTTRVLWITHPPTLQYRNMFSPHLIIFDLIDEPSDEFLPWRNGMDEVVAQADGVIVTSDQLYDFAHENWKGKHIYKIKNGVDPVIFSWKKERKVPQVMSSMVAKGIPIIGFHGSLQTWLDYSLLEEVIKLRPQYKFVFIGPLFTAMPSFSSLPNVVMVGPVEHQYLPDYLHYFDVGLIPFQVRQMTHGANPIKLYEYLAAGIPVAATPIRECLHLQPYVKTADTAIKFAQIIDAQIQVKQDKKLREEMLRIAGENSWVSKAKEATKIFEFLYDVKKQATRRSVQGI